MSIVIARKFGDRIVTLSYSMISDVNEPRANILPGRLKSIVVSERLTISYAGLSTQAIDLIREIARSAQKASLNGILNRLIN